MSAVSLWKNGAPNADVLAAMDDVRSSIRRILNVANTADEAAVAAINEYYTLQSMTHLSIWAAEEAWNSFAIEYEQIIESLSACNSVPFAAYSTAGSAKTAHDKLCPTLYDLSYWLGQVETLANNITFMCRNASADSGAQLGESALELASLAHQYIIWKLGWHWPAIWANNWPNATANVHHIDVNEGTPDYLSFLAKTDNGGGSEVANWWKFSAATYAADGAWWTPNDLSTGDRCIVEYATFTKDTSDGSDPGYNIMFVERRKVFSITGASVNSIHATRDDVSDLPDWTGIEVPYDVNFDEPQIPMSQFVMRRIILA